MNTPPALRGSPDPLKVPLRFTIRAGRTFEWNHDWPFYETRRVQLVNTNKDYDVCREKKWPDWPPEQGPDAG